MSDEKNSETNRRQNSISGKCIHVSNVVVLKIHHKRRHLVNCQKIKWYDIVVTTSCVNSVLKPTPMKPNIYLYQLYSNIMRGNNS